MRRIPITSILLISILLVASVLRCYNLFEIPLTNDELSALLRIEFNSFSELIQFGVLPDGHPALTQIGLYYYTQLFGTSAWVIKLPFILCGLLSIYFTYKIASVFNNKNLGLLTAGFIATSQFFVMYSQLARPYIIGVLAVLIMVHLGLRIIYAERKTIIHYFTLGLFMLLASLTHYFAMLVVVLWATFMIMLERKDQRKHLWFTYLCVCLAYLPHLNIFLQQLSRGGIGGSQGWLDKPDGKFIIQFIYYLLQYYWINVLIIGVCILVSLYQLLKAPSKEIRLLVVGIMLFVSSYAIGYFYSIYRNPVLQYSTLIFSTPFILLFIFYGVSKLKQRFVWFVLMLVVTSNVFALIQIRKHYQLFYHQGYKAVVESTIGFHEAALFMDGNHTSYFDYYFRTFHRIPKYYTTQLDTFSFQAFESKLSQLKEDTLILAYGKPGNLTFLNIAQKYYPIFIKEERGAAFETFVLYRSSSKSKEVYSTSQFDSLLEYGKQVHLEISKNETQKIDYSVSVYIESENETIDPILVLSIKSKDGKELVWQGLHFQDYHLKGEQTTLLTARWRSQDFYQSLQDLNIQAFVWNSKKEKFKSTIPQIQILKGNALMYGIINDFN